MVRYRDPAICNLKAGLLFLVIFGHMIEPEIAANVAVRGVYKGIYFFHMPAFVCLTGYFTRHKDGAKARSKQFLFLYCVLQAVAWVLQLTKSLLIPFWHLWYLLSAAVWECIYFFFDRWIEKKRCLILLISMTAALLIGYLPMDGRVLSLSRTVVFFPFFLLGCFLQEYKALSSRKIGAIGLIGACLLVMILWDVEPSFLYQVSAYHEARDVLYRLGTLMVGMMICPSLMRLAPKRIYPWTKAGGDTLVPYLFHAPLVTVVRTLLLPVPLCAVAAVLIYAVTYKASLLRRPLLTLVCESS